MNKIKYHAVIKFYFFKGKSPTKIKAELNCVYGNLTPLFITEVAEFKHGRMDIFYEERSGYPKTTTADKIMCMKLMDNCRLRQIKQLRSHLNVWVPLKMRKLNEGSKTRLVFLKCFKRVVTGDETGFTTIRQRRNSS